MKEKNGKRESRVGMKLLIHVFSPLQFWLVATTKQILTTILDRIIIEEASPQDKTFDYFNKKLRWRYLLHTFKFLCFIYGKLRPMYSKEVYLILVKLNLGIWHCHGCPSSWNLQETVVLSLPLIRVPHNNLEEEDTQILITSEIIMRAILFECVPTPRWRVKFCCVRLFCTF